MATILQPKNELTIRELLDHAIHWRERDRSEKTAKRKMYCRIQVIEAINELLNRDANVKELFGNTDIVEYIFKSKCKKQCLPADID